VRKFIYNFLKVTLLVVCLTFIFSPRASAEWTKYSTSPILSPGGGSWDTFDIRNPSVIHEGSEYKMWYDGYDGTHWKIGYATSSDGIHWTKLITPVIDFSQQNLNTAEPDVLYENGIYRMWFTVLTPSLQSKSFDYTESPDGINWSTPQSVLTATGPWENQFINNPTVIKIGDEYRLYYDGKENGIWNFAVATSLDGINWIKPINNPLFSANGFEFPTIGLGSILYDGSKYIIFYHAKEPSSVFYNAISMDGNTWTRQNTPILVTSPNSFDSVRFISPFVLKDGNQYKMWYTGYNGSHWSIGYATEPVSDTTSVPLLKQTDSQWGNEIYDSATQWITGNEQPTISWWGCAVTSLAMVLQHYGYNLLPDSTPLNPGTLNTWLLSQPDGYINGGLVNWIAITRLTMQAKSVNHINDIDALEFQWVSGANKTQLTQDLNNSQPDILEEPGHFVVGTQVEGNTFDINDPYYNRTTLNNGYNNTFLSLRKYTPSQTDLSYILLTIDPSITVVVKDSQGNNIGQQVVENPIINPISTTSGSLKPVKEILIEKPTSGSYNVTISSNNSSTYDFSLYLYDKNGEVKNTSQSGIVGRDNTDTFTIFMNTDSLDTSTINKSVTFQTILNELNQMYRDKYIKVSAYRSLTSLVKNAGSDYQHKRSFQTKIKVDTAIFLTNSIFTRTIDELPQTILLQDLQSLKATL
jgi:predicted GH43/DUF377 family glycosyl hydrolase